MRAQISLRPRALIGEKNSRIFYTDEMTNESADFTEAAALIGEKKFPDFFSTDKMTNSVDFPANAEADFLV